LHVCQLDGRSRNHQYIQLFPEEEEIYVTSVVFAADGQEVMGGGSDGLISIYDRECSQISLKVKDTLMTSTTMILLTAHHRISITGEYNE
jgi:hypothetical protein